VVHAQAQTFEHGRQVPGIDAASVHRGLAADRFEPRPMQKGRLQRMMLECLVEPRERAGSVLMRREQRRVGRQGGRAAWVEQRVQHQGHPRKWRARPSGLDLPARTRCRTGILPVAPASFSVRSIRAANGQGRSFIVVSGVGQDTGLKLITRGEGRGQLCRQGVGQHQLVTRHADRRVDAAQGILDDNTVALAAQDQADAGIVAGLACRFPLGDSVRHQSFQSLVQLQISLNRPP
jgi:hypothetical protein